MKIVCTQENLKLGINTVNKIATQNSSLPILNSVLIETELGQLKLSVTNLEMSEKIFIRCKTEVPGKICVPIRILNGLVDSLPKSNTITLELIDNNLLVTSGGFSAKLKTINPLDFPVIPKIEQQGSCEMDFTIFKTALSKIAFAVSLNETQPEISGVLLEFEGDILKMVATDRYRLGSQVINLGKTNSPKKLIIPQKTVNEIIRFGAFSEDKLVLSWNDTQVSFVLGGFELVSRLIDGVYPEYEHIIPKNELTTVKLDRTEFLSALKTTGVFTDSSSTIKLVYTEKEVSLLSLSDSFGQSECRVQAEVQGPVGEVMFNYKYIQDVLTILKNDTLKIKIINDSSPVIFESEEEIGYLYLVMPIKL